MNNTSITTGIAVAAAIAIIVIFFFFRGSVYSLFSHNSIPSTTQKVSKTTQKTPVLPSTNKLSIANIIVGTGTVAKQGDTITVDYIGKLSNGTIFDSSAAHKKPFTFVLGIGQVIQGWDKGIIGMKVGGTRILVIPPSLGYGGRTVGPIPANSTLTFEVKLIKVTPPKK